jgi:cytochrome c
LSGRVVRRSFRTSQPQAARRHSRLAYEVPPRQGPTLFNIVGRRAGKADGYHHSPNFASADFVWDDHTLDAWLVNPQAAIAGATMAYRQAKPAARAAIISYLKELH